MADDARRHGIHHFIISVTDDICPQHDRRGEGFRAVALLCLLRPDDGDARIPLPVGGERDRLASG